MLMRGMRGGFMKLKIRPYSAAQVLSLGILLSFLLAQQASATQFALIVPLSMTVNTSGGLGVSGNSFAGWLVATSAPIQPPPEVIQYAAVSNNANITGYNVLVVLQNAIGLLPGNVETAGSNGITGTQFFSALLLPSEQTVLASNVGLYYATSF